MILILLPEDGYDATESTIPWQILTESGYTVRFATPTGKIAPADERVLSLGFGPLSPLLMTKKPVLKTYQRMVKDPAFQNPFSYQDIAIEQIAGVIVPGGHGPGMKTMLESKLLQGKIVEAFKQNKAIGAICTGVLLIARSIDPNTGKSVLYGRKSTTITKFMELTGWSVTWLWLKDYFRSLPSTAQDQVCENLQSEKDFLKGPIPLLPFYHKNLACLQFTVRDKNYLSARWPGDCFRFSNQYIELLKQQGS